MDHHNSVKKTTNKIQKKGKTSNLDYSRKRTSKTQAVQVGKYLFTCQFCPVDKAKVYQSFPALYTHVHNKHKGNEISSAKPKTSKERTTPIYKLVSIMHKAKNGQRQKLQWELIQQINQVHLALCGYLKSWNFIDQSLIGDKNTEQAIQNVIKRANEEAFLLGMSDQIMNSVKDSLIFQQYFGKLSLISFGKDIVRFFSKCEEAAIKLYLDLALIQAKQDKSLTELQLNTLKKKIWGDHQYVTNLLGMEWSKWKKIDKSLLLNDYQDQDNQSKKQDQLIQNDLKQLQDQEVYEQEEEEEEEQKEEEEENIQKIDKKVKLDQLDSQKQIIINSHEGN